MADTAVPESVGLAWVPPSGFDQFTVLRPLGRGGMGHVYLGRDRALDRLVALKFISSRHPSDAVRERFLVEARAIARLSHPNVVSVFSIGEVAGRPYIAYEFVSGNSLDRIALPLAWQVALRLAVGAARGLEGAHREGILHRDLKPGNIILSERGEVKLLDFGLAKLDESPRLASSEPIPVAAYDVEPEGNTVDALTRPGALMGTPAYMAPELWCGEPASQRTDVFALGLVFYELIAGKLPHGGFPSAEIARRLVEEDLPPVRSFAPELPESLGAVIDRAVRRDPAERFPSAAELRSALEEIQKIFLPTQSGAEPIDKARLAVAASFYRVREQGDAFISSIYERLFAIEPAARALFPSDLSAQRQKLLHMFGLVLGAIAEPERLAPVLEDLGRRHLHYSVEPQHFRALEKALLGALEAHDAAWNDDVARGWQRSFSFIESAMTRGMSSEHNTVLTDDSGSLRRKPLPLERWPRAPEPKAPIPEGVRTRYALNDDVTLAYQTFGTGPIDLVLVLGSITHVELNWQHPTLATFLGRLAQIARVTVFDKRGTGLSDRAFDPESIEERIDDLTAVMDHTGVKRALLFGVSDGAAIAARFTAAQPARVSGLALYGASTTGLTPEQLQARATTIRERWGEPLFVDDEAPSMAHDKAYCTWLALYQRMASSPGNAIKMTRTVASSELAAILPSLSLPTLVLHRTGDRVVPVAAGRALAEQIRGARFVELRGDDHLPYVGDIEPLLAEVEALTRLLAAQPPRP